MIGQESLDRRDGGDEVSRQLRVRCPAYEDEQTNTVLYYSSEFVRLVANVAIVAQCDPASLPDCAQPFLIAGIRREVVGVPLDREAGRSQDFWKPGAEVAIGEEDKAQAVRS